MNTFDGYQRGSDGYLPLDLTNELPIGTTYQVIQLQLDISPQLLRPVGHRPAFLVNVFHIVRPERQYVGATQLTPPPDIPPPTPGYRISIPNVGLLILSFVNLESIHGSTTQAFLELANYTETITVRVDTHGNELLLHMTGR